MTDLQKACLTVIRIEGPIRRREVAWRLEERHVAIHDACVALMEAGCLFFEKGHWDVTPQGRLRFSQIHRKRPSRSDLVAKLKARGEWQAK